MGWVWNGKGEKLKAQPHWGLELASNLPQRNAGTVASEATICGKREETISRGYRRVLRCVEDCPGGKEKGIGRIARLRLVKSQATPDGDKV